MRPPPGRPDDGFTLVELVVTLTIVALVGSLFALAAFQSITITADASSSLADSASRSQLTTRLREDIQTAASLGRDGGPCDAPAGTTQVLWTAPSDDPDAGSVSYEVRAGGGGEPNQLTRRTCGPDGGSSGPVVAQWPGSGRVVVTCDGGGSCGARSPLAADLAKGARTVRLRDPDGFPASGPYRVRVAGELATVVGGFGTPTLTLAAPVAVDHDAGSSTVSYVPAAVTVQVPDGDAARFGSDDPFTLTVARRTS